jgi:hypothetical protein
VERHTAGIPSWPKDGKKVVDGRVRGQVLVGEIDAFFPLSKNPDGSSSASSKDVLA